MSKYHDSGTICKATERACPLGLSDGEHIEATDEQDFQEKLSQKMGSNVTTISSNDLKQKELSRASANSASERRGNVSRATDLCEDALSTDSNIQEIAVILSEKPLKELPTVFKRKNPTTKQTEVMSAPEIASLLNDWKVGLSKLYPNTKIESKNKGGNAAASDLVAISKNGDEQLIEAKFGAATNSAPGIKRVSSILGTECFSYSSEEREKIKNLYLNQGPEKALEKISADIESYAKTFNERSHEVDSKAVFDLIKSSGAEGNSNENDDYKIYTFGKSRGAGTIKEIPLSLRRDTEWTVKAEPSIQEDSSRLNYIFTSKDGTKTIRLTYNNKNSNKIKDANGNTVRIPSKMFTGVGSYNVWYSES